MANNNQPEPLVIRLIVRVSVPELEIEQVPDIQRQIMAVVRGLPGAEVELSTLPTLPVR